MMRVSHVMFQKGFWLAFILLGVAGITMLVLDEQDTRAGHCKSTGKQRLVYSQLHETTVPENELLCDGGRVKWVMAIR